MSTQKSIRRAMYNRYPDAIGRVHDISALAAQTLTVTALATGTVNAEKFIRKWAIRPEASNAANRNPRIISDFLSTTGVLTHAGTAYSDTTATGEKVEILDYEPFLIDNAIQVALGRLRRMDRTIIPARNDGKVYLHDLTWIGEPADITKITWSGSPVLSRNRGFEKWNTVTTAGALEPDNWTLAGAAGTVARSTTQNRKGRYTAALTRAGTDTTLTQIVGLLDTGVSDDSLRGKTVTAVAVLWASVASRVRVQVTDGVTTSSSSYHTGDSTWQELSVEHTVSATATTLSVIVSLETGDTTIYADEAYICRDTLTDAVRRDNYGETQVAAVGYTQVGGLVAHLQPRATGQWAFYAARPYPTFDADRVIAGTADADESDAPEVITAVGALGAFYETMYFKDDNPRWAKLANSFNADFQDMAMRHLYMEMNGAMPGVQIPGRGILWNARRA